QRASSTPPAAVKRSWNRAGGGPPMSGRWLGRGRSIVLGLVMKSPRDSNIMLFPGRRGGRSSPLEHDHSLAARAAHFVDVTKAGRSEHPKRPLVFSQHRGARAHARPTLLAVPVERSREHRAAVAPAALLR